MYKYIFYKIITCLFIALEAAIVRYLSGGSSIYLYEKLSVYAIIFFQSLFSVLFLFFILKKYIFKLFMSSFVFLNFFRAVLNIFGIGLWYLSLQKIPVIQVISVSFISPIISVFGAIFFFKEKLTLKSIVIVITSFIGFFFSMRPDFLWKQIYNFNIILLLPLCASFCMAVSKILVRKLMIFKHSPWQLIVCLFSLIIPICLIFFFKYGWIFPKYYHWFWLILLGVLNICINYFFAKSYILGDIITLLPFGIAAKLIFAGSISFYLFNEITNSFPIIMGFLIGLCNFILLFYNYIFYYFIKFK
ncbi:MAG: DMT family transporter [Candidatus Azosocius agrarius]|nr:MAG: DMT family transporter [Gammaproteobacteria bacterium]